MGLVSSGYNGVVYAWKLKDQIPKQIFFQKGIIINSAFKIPE